MDKKEAESLPYIVALRDHMVAGAGHEVYGEGLDKNAPLGEDFFVLRLDEIVKDPETGFLKKLGIHPVSGNIELDVAVGV